MLKRRAMSSSRSPDRGLHALAGVALILVTVLAAGMTWPPTHALTYWILTDETGPVELSTFACFIIAAVVSARLAAETRRRGGGRSSSVVYGLFALFMFLAAMEEISWGQSLLDFRTPAWLNEINAQGETNLHNLDPLTNLSSLGGPGARGDRSGEGHDPLPQGKAESRRSDRAGAFAGTDRGDGGDRNPE